MLRKFTIFMLIAILLSGNYLPIVSANGELGSTSSMNSDGEYSYSGQFVLPDNPIKPPIGSDPSRYYDDVAIIKNLIVNEGKDIGHTGFSATLWYWSNDPQPRDDGTESHWVAYPKVSTDNGHIDKQNYRAKDFTAEQLGVTPEMYAKMVEKDTKINITVDSREDKDRNIYSKLVQPTKEEALAMIADGKQPYAFLYYDNDVKLNFTFSYKEDKPKPKEHEGYRTEIVYVPPTWGSGEVSWGMFKNTLAESGSSETKIRWINGLTAGSHVGQTGGVKRMTGVTQSSSNSVDTVAGQKGKETYSLNYEYTDYRIDTYACINWIPITATDSDGNSYIVDWYCGAEVLSGSAPYWENGSSYSCSVTLAVDHRYGETFEGEHGFEQTMNIGRSATVPSESCSPSEKDPNTETITHESSPVKLPTQTYMSFMEKPFEWKGNPMHNEANIFPYVKGATEQGFAGVPELDPTFKTLNKYTQKHEAFENPYAIPLRNEVSGTTMNILSKEDFWVSRSTGYVTSSEHGKDLASVTEQTKDEYSLITGQEYRDEILDRSDLTSMYYLPIDANDNVMKPNTDYKMETQVNGLGYNNITIMHDQKYQFENYLLGSIFEEDVEDVADFEGVWIVEQNEIPFNDVVYSYSTTITPEQAMAISNATKGRTNFIFGHKGTDNMTVFDQVKTILNNNKFGEKSAKTIPHLTDVDKADETL